MADTVLRTMLAEMAVKDNEELLGALRVVFDGISHHHKLPIHSARLQSALKQPDHRESSLGSVPPMALEVQNIKNLGDFPKQRGGPARERIHIPCCQLSGKTA